jgi:hypothetical protein
MYIINVIADDGSFNVVFKAYNCDWSEVKASQRPVEKPFLDCAEVLIQTMSMPSLKTLRLYAY